MDCQSVHDQLRQTRTVDIGHHFSHGLKSNVRSSSHVFCGVKTEMVDGYQSGQFDVKLESPRDVLNGADGVGTSGMCDFRCRHHQSLSPEAEAGAWLRDEPVDIGSNGGFLRSWSASTVGRDSVGTGGIEEESMEMCGSPFFPEVALGSPGCAPNLSENVSHSNGVSNLFAELRATKIKESVLREAMQRLGGGQKGLRALVKVIFLWLRQKNRSSQSGDRISHSDISDEIDKFLWRNAGQGNTMDVPYASFSGSAVSSGLQEDVNYSMNSMAALRRSGGSLSELRMGGACGSAEYGEVPNYENQHRIFVGESGKLDGMVDGMGVPGLGTQGSGVLSTDASPMSSGCWMPPTLPPDGLQCTKVRKLSPSPDPTGLLSVATDVSVYEDGQSHKNKIRRLSPPPTGYSSSQSSSELSSYGGFGSPSVSDVLGTPSIFGSVGANPFAPGGPFSMSPSSPPALDPHSLDSGPFTSFGLQSSMLMDENLQGCGLIDRLGPLYPGSPENSLDRGSSLARLKTVAKTKASPAASTRLARKNRMDRNRKAASHHVSRASSQACASPSVVSGSVWPVSSSNSLRSTHQCQEFPSSEGQHNVQDRRDKEHLQFLLQKVLRPSDVGNLGRIVLPKKDAETHLPWLGAREGVQFNCEDYDTGEKMVLRYRFWPNNKSRMYLLENTGDFVKKHKLQESDKLLIYRNQQQGTYIIRARKGQDCLDVLSSQVKVEKADGKEKGQQNSPEGTCSSGAPSSDKDVGTSETIGVSGLDAATSDSVVATVTSIVTQQDDLLNFADLPDAPMGDGTENLVRFPSLEAFDVEMLELVSPAPEKEDVKTSQCTTREV